MTTRPNLDRVWASNATAGDIQDPDSLGNAGKVDRGWEAEIPPHQWFNWIQNRQDLAKLALAERGIFEWGSDITYAANALCYAPDNQIYIAVNTSGVNKNQTPINNPSWWVKSAVHITQADLDAVIATVNTHIANTGNPHNVTAEQVNTYIKSVIDDKVAVVRADVDAHIARTDDPHQVTAAQAGAVPVTGGSFTGRVNFQDVSTIFNQGNTPETNTVTSLASGEIKLSQGNKQMGLDDSGNPYWQDASGTREEFLHSREDSYPAEKLRVEPRYAVPRPDVHLPLISDHNLYEGIGTTSFERNTTATYIHPRTGQITRAEIDELRYEREGLLHEGSSTNMLGNSENILAWSETGTGEFTRTRSLDGDYYVGRLTQAVPAATAGIAWWDTLTTDNTKLHSISVWIRANKSFTLNWGGGADVIGGTEPTRTITTSTEWVKHSVQAYGIETSSGSGQYRLPLRLYFNGSADVGDWFEVRGMQIEARPLATSYIPTTNSALTRGYDNLSLSIDNRYLAIEGRTISMWAQSLTNSTINPGSGPRQGLWAIEDSGRDSLLQNFGGNFEVRYDPVRIVSTQTPSQPTVYTTTCDNQELKLYNNGVLVGTQPTTGSHDTQGPVFYIGRGSGSWYFFGHIRNFQMWRRVLTPEQVTTLGG